MAAAEEATPQTAPERPFPLHGRAYIAAVSICGALALADSVRRIVETPPEAGWIVLAALTWISGAFAIKIPSLAATISISEVFVVTLAILFGCPTATVTVAADGFISSLLQKNLKARRVLFNIAEPALSTWAAARVYERVGGPPPLSVAPSSLNNLAIPVLLFAGVYLLSNTWLIFFAMGIETGTRPSTLWRRHFSWISLNFIGGASIALLLTSNLRHVSVELVLVVLPLLFILHLVFSTWTSRLKEAEQHVAEVNRLYLSTVEALAIAVESKDQVTHGHVRRVQSLALAVARRLGVTDVQLLRALESGALLHDMGKVAIPDHILNKPGKLTPAEYELMKLHAPIGAEILAPVDFPYPVVPLVRHHHEHWDGTGYPDGLAGEAIPLGARILSVVDCFDALTSDRPYRRALSAEDAIRIIREKAGSTYDPSVVTALESVSPAAAVASAEPPLHVSVLIARANAKPAPESAVAPSVPAEWSSIADWIALDHVWPLLCASPGERAADIAAAALGAVLRSTTSATTVWIGRTDLTRQHVEVAHVSGHGEAMLRGRSIPLGEGLSGWVAANHSVMIDSDPALDFPAQIGQMQPRPKAALTVPIDRSGVLTLYTDSDTGFSPTDLAHAQEAAARLDLWLSQFSHAGSNRPRILREQAALAGLVSAAGTPRAGIGLRSR